MGKPLMKPFTAIPQDPWYLRLAHSVAFIKDAPEFFQQQENKHGPIFRCNLFGVNSLRVHGPDFVERVYKNSEEWVAIGPAWEPALMKIFPQGLLMKDGAHHLAHRRILQQAFSKAAMATYFNQIQEWADDLVAELPERLDFYPFIKAHTLNIALKLFLGIEQNDPTGQRVATHFNAILAGSMALVRWPLLNNKFHRAVKGRRQLIEVFHCLLTQRKQKTRKDLLSFLLQAKDEQGFNLSDEQIVDHVIFMMLAAHDTTASALCSLLYWLTEKPSWQEKVRQELAAAKLNQPKDLQPLNVTDNVFKETLRLFPPIVTMPRVINHDCEILGYQVPAGTQTGINTFECDFNCIYGYFSHLRDCRSKC